MEPRNGLDRNLLGTLRMQAVTEAEILPRRLYRQRLNSILAIVVDELLQQMNNPELPSRQGLNKLTQSREWKASFRLPKLEEPIPFSEEILLQIANQAQQAWLFLPAQHIIRPYYQELMKTSLSLLVMQYNRSILD
jgi:hypothetical protein